MDDRPTSIGSVEGSADQTIKHRFGPSGCLLFSDTEHRASARNSGEWMASCARACRVIVRAPHRNRWVCTELVHESVGRVHCIGLDAAFDFTPHRHVLPDEHAGPVRCVVQLGARYMAFDSQQVQAQVLCSGNITRDLFGGRVGGKCGGRPHVDAFGKQSFAINPQHVVLHPDLAQPNSAFPDATDRTVDLDADGYPIHRLVAQLPRPPQLRVSDGEIPFEHGCATGQVVLARRHHWRSATWRAQRGGDGDRAGFITHEMATHMDLGRCCRRFGADQPVLDHAHGTSRHDAHWLPDTTTVLVADDVGIIEDAVQIAGWFVGVWLL